jgi:curved DNA-binding protein
VEYVDGLEDLFGGGFSDFFTQIFGGMGGFRGQQPQGGRGRSPFRQQPQIHEVEMLISLFEAYSGSTRNIKINDRRFEVKVPKGADNGTKLRLKGAGPQGDDVHLVLKVSPDPRFERKGDRLNTEVEIDLFTAVLGGEAKVPTFSGEGMLKIPAGTQPGQTFRLKGRGMPHLKDKTQGDLYVTVHVRLPEKLTDKQRRLFEQLSDS